MQKLVPSSASLAFLAFLLLRIGLAFSEPVESNAPAAAPNTADPDSSQITYDQRQTGKYNIHLSIKDVAIIDVDQHNYEDVAYDADDYYYYDESHLTIKPVLSLQSTTTPQPLTLVPSTIQTSSPKLNSSSSIPTISSTIPSTISSSEPFSPNLLLNIAEETQANNNFSNSEDLLPLSNFTLDSILTDTEKNGAEKENISPEISSTIKSNIIQARSEVLAPFMLSGKAAGSHKFLQRPHLRFIDTAADDNLRKEKENNLKLKIRRAQKQSPKLGYPIPHSTQSLIAKGCRRHQYRDARGECRTKRSSSILKKLFNMLLTSLPFPDRERDEGEVEIFD